MHRVDTGGAEAIQLRHFMSYENQIEIVSGKSCLRLFALANADHPMLICCDLQGNGFRGVISRSATRIRQFQKGSPSLEVSCVSNALGRLGGPKACAKYFPLRGGNHRKQCGWLLVAIALPVELWKHTCNDSNKFFPSSKPGLVGRRAI